MAWLGFTMPSALILLAFALSASAFTGPVAEGFLHGLKLVAIAVVAQAVWGITRTLTPDRARAMIALAAIVGVVIVAGSFGQIAAIALGAVAGLRFCRGEPAQLSGQLRFPVSRRGGMAAPAVFAALFLMPLVLSSAAGHQAIALFEAFYRSGALVFGGGHVVLPLLQAEAVAPGWVTNETFLAGYGLAQVRQLRSSRSFFPACCSSMGCFPSGTSCALANPFKPPCEAQTLQSSAFLGWLSTIRFGRAASARRETSRSLLADSCC